MTPEERLREIWYWNHDGDWEGRRPSVYEHELEAEATRLMEREAKLSKALNKILNKAHGEPSEALLDIIMEVEAVGLAEEAEHDLE